MIRLQEMAYEDIPTKRVLIGTSLSLGIKLNSLDSFYNFSAGGGKPIVSMKILKKIDKIPKELYLETNYLMIHNVENLAYNKSLFTPILYDMRRLLPILQEKNQPMNYIGAFLDRCTQFLSGPSYVKQSNDSLQNKKDALSIKEKVLLEKVNLKKISFDDTTGFAELVKSNIRELQVLVDYYKQKGTVIYFYEMPIDCRLENANKLTYSRKVIKEFSIKNNILFLPTEDCHEYSTSDGMHLNEECVNKYNDFFEKQFVSKN
jgi:hypothetical protein